MANSNTINFSEVVVSGNLTGLSGMTLAGGTVAVSTPVLAMTQTWNGAGVQFDAITLDITNTTSSSLSRLMQLMVGGVSQFRVTRTGAVTAVGNITSGADFVSTVGSVQTVAGVFNAGVITTNTPAVNASQTWNSGADQFQGIRLSITDTASLATSLLANFLVGAATKFSVGKVGDIVSSAGTITASAPALTATQTWNNAGVTFTALLMNITDTASAAASLAADIQVASSTIWNLSKVGTATHTLNALATTPTAGVMLTNTTAAAAGAQQVSPAIRWLGNGWKTNATAASQTVEFRAYVLPIQGAAAPTASWNLEFAVNSGAFTTCITVSSTGSLGCAALVCTGNISGTNITAGGGSTIIFSGRSRISCPADSQLLVTNSATTDFNRLMFGGTTSSFPALKRAAAVLECRLADDSGYAGFTASAYNVGATAGASGGPFTAITSITVVNGIITAITGT